MGMPISNYSVLKALGDDSLSVNSYEKHTAREVLNPFRLFVFIIHEPDLHKELNDVITKQFSKWHFLTGEQMLFFALVDPPDEWVRSVQPGGYDEYFKSYYHEALFDPRNAIKSIDPSASAFAIATQLKIPAAKLPCIVVTDNFEHDEFVWFSTCPEHIEDQLLMLREIAEQAGDPVSALEDKSIDMCEGYGRETIRGNLANTLSQVLAFIVLKTSRNSWLREMAESQVFSLISSLRTDLVDVKNKAKDLFDDTINDLSNFCLKAASLLSLSSDKTYVEPIVHIDRNFIENESFRILRTADRVADALRSNPPNIEFDHTPVLMCLAKVFEIEANLSVVHWARRRLGVDIPPYFNRYQPGVAAIYISGNGNPIDLNRRSNDDHWIPPGIGQSRHACRELAQQRLPSGWDLNSWRLLIRKWGTVNRYRNVAAHTALVGEDEVHQVSTAINALSNNMIFEKFSNLKCRYRGNR